MEKLMTPWIEKAHEEFAEMMEQADKQKDAGANWTDEGWWQRLGKKN